MPKIEISDKGNKCTYNMHVVCIFSLHWSDDQASVSRILFCCLFASECTANILVVNWPYILCKKESTDNTSLCIFSVNMIYVCSSIYYEYHLNRRYR